MENTSPQGSDMGWTQVIGKALLFLILAFTLSSQAEAQTRVFTAPVSNVSVSIGFNSLNGAHAGWYHTGVDFMGGYGTPILSSNFGRVAFVQTMSAGDHGMGNCVIIEHTLPDMSVIYTLYAHMSAILVSNGQWVWQGNQIGKMGGSGYGKSNYWETHLHFEMKTAATSGNPSGGGPYWGYTPTPAQNYGYRNPYDFLGRVAAVSDDDSAPVLNFFRYYNPESGDHFYTTRFRDLGRSSSGYYVERIQCHVLSGPGDYRTQLYRYWNAGIGDHFYTTNLAELWFGGSGYVYEGVPCYVYQWQLGGTVPLYRYWNPDVGDHFYTTNWNELGNGAGGYYFERVQCYVLQ